NATEFIRETQISGDSMNFGAALQFRAQPVAQLVYICANLLKERPRDPLALVQKSRKKMLIGNFRMITLRREVLCRLQRFLHLLGVFIDAHSSRITRERRFPNRRLRGSYRTGFSCGLSDRK